ncbi:MAG: hypothetical protein ACRCXK_14030, partial [Wohlfahrtiimonas sp.]
DHQWIGFFKDIQSRFDAINIPSNWNLTSRSGRALTIFYWCWQGTNAQQYLQLEKYKKSLFRLSIRIQPSNKNLQKLCITHFQKNYAISQFRYIEIIHKAKNIKEGKSSIIMNILPKFKIEEGDILNIDDMFSFLKEATEFLSQHYWTTE